ncbi:hypothetical protein, partial [Escherichia coli]|uniref:hypothetical protein n=1 Tax=Escherichia coli TaxID=562 RepID=UPI0028DE6484
SRESSGEQFLQTVDPAYAVFTVRANTLLPAASTLERFTAQGVTALRTDETGEITIIPTRDGYRIDRYLPEETH